MKDNNFIEMNKKYVFDTYGRAPIMLVSGSGCRVRDSEGREYLDFIGGLAACPLGHSHPKLADAIALQAKKLIHVSNLFYIEPQIQLAKELVEHTFADKVFFCNSGAEANEGAIKLARKFFHDRGEHDRYHIITMENSFHGRTLATLAATGQVKYRQGFEPETPGFAQVPFGDIESLKNAVNKTVAAIMIEPIQGEGGVRVPPPDFLADVRRLCDTTGCLMVLDEVQTGMGRTGRLFAHEHYDIAPDIMTVAKGLAGGVPMGAVLAVDKVACAMTPGTHATTFGGNPLAAAAGLAVITEILSDGFLDGVKAKGEYLKTSLKKLAQRQSIIKEVRGIGLMQAIDLTMPGADIVVGLRNSGVLVNCTAETVLRFLPPLIISEEEIDEMITALDKQLEKVSGGC